MKIFVTGVTGFLGRSFLEHLRPLLGPDDRVFLLTRRPLDLNPEDSRFIQVDGTLEDVEGYKKELMESDYIFHFAANAVFGNGEVYDRVNYLPTRAMVDLLKGSKRLKNFIFTSTIGAVDRAPGDLCKGPLTLESTPNPRSDYGASKLKAENYIKESKIPYTIVRPTWVYGRDMRANSHINVFVGMASDKGAIIKINFPARVSLIHVDDLAVSLVNCIGNKKCLNKIYFGETESATLGEIFALLYEKIHGSPLKQFPMLHFSSLLGRLHHRLPLTIGSLFLDYLYAKDDDFVGDLLTGHKCHLFATDVIDVIETNAKVVGCWIITGANSGIGLSIAEKLDRAGKRLVLIDRATENLKDFSSGHTIIKADLSKFSQIKRLAARIKDEKIHCLINNAGIGYRKSFEDISLDEINKIIAVNSMAPLYITKLLMGQLIRDGSVIVNLASSIAYNPLPNMLMYSATKSFISNWSESLTYELRDTNRVVTVSPSGTNTNFQKSSGVKHDEEGKGLLTSDFVADSIIGVVSSKKKVLVLGTKTKVLLLFSRFLPRSLNITFWGKLFEKMR